MTVSFGLCVPIFASPGHRLFRTPNYDRLDVGSVFTLSRSAEYLGYHALWVADHLMLGKDQAILEGWTVLSALAGCTDSVKLGIIHQANLFRNPALAAKMAATVDQISDGRFIYFTDPGSAAHEHIAYGLPWTEDMSRRIDDFEEGLKLVLDLWTSSTPVTYGGQYHSISSAICEPKPVQSPHPPVWIGSTNKQMHRICARYAQGWNTTPVSIEALRERLGDLAEACDDEGRNFAEIEKSLEIQILIGRDHDSIRDRIRQIISLTPDQQIEKDLADYITGSTSEPPASIASTWLIGTSEEITERIQSYMDVGISHFMLWFVDAPDDEGLHRFSEDVMPNFLSG